MKKLILVLVLLLTILSTTWADDDKVSLVKEYTDVPIELRGTWYTLSFSTDEGETADDSNRPLILATQFYLCTVYYNDRIVKAELFTHKYGPSYFLYSEDKGVVYIIVFYKEAPDTPVVYMMKNDVEQFRSCVKIVKI